MEQALPQGRNKRARATRDGVLLARTPSGERLPVLDLSNPRFSVDDSDEAIGELHRALAVQERNIARLPGFLFRALLACETRRSSLMTALYSRDAGFLDGLSTYMMKLGPENLPPGYDTAANRRFVSAPQTGFLRIRALQTAKLIALGLRSDLQRDATRPLALINIAGGPAMDTINALILLHRESRDLLLRRPIELHVLDVDPRGPAFGRDALSQLIEEGPLRGLRPTFQHHPYDWNHAELLAALVERLAATNVLIAGSSEGGLFEYGSDAAVIENLRALHGRGRGARVVVGSVTRADESRRRAAAGIALALVPRGADLFEGLALQAGYGLVESRPTLWSDQVLLAPHASGPAAARLSGTVTLCAS